MTTRHVGPKLFVGATVGLLLGLIALVDLILAGALILLLLFLLGRYAPNSPLVPTRGDHEAQRRRDDYWRRFPRVGFAGERHNGRHLDRHFAALAECENGHYDIHPIGRRIELTGQVRITRRCGRYPECTSTWSELA